MKWRSSFQKEQPVGYWKAPDMIRLLLPRSQKVEFITKNIFFDFFMMISFPNMWIYMVSKDWIVFTDWWRLYNAEEQFLQGNGPLRNWNNLPFFGTYLPPPCFGCLKFICSQVCTSLMTTTHSISWQMIQLSPVCALEKFVWLVIF